jgi:CDP-diacylglycerol--glycerol-3-phosphate 3-phosphatidyltransferase
MKIIVSLITISRFIGAFSLLLFNDPVNNPFFYVVYALCIVSDVTDGHLARWCKVTTNLGALMDTVADVTLIAVVLFIFIPLPGFLDTWMLYLIATVILTRVVACSIGYYKFKTFTILHTYSNKAAGLVMACFPVYYYFFGATVMMLIVFTAAFLSAFEELIITIRFNELNRNRKHLFDKG